jgi:hypothetical protein
VRRTGRTCKAALRASTVAMAVLLLPTAGLAAYSDLLAVVAGAAPSVTYWSGTTTYPGRAGYQLNFTRAGSHLTYFFIGGECKRVGYQLLETDINFPADAPIHSGKFDLNYTDHRRDPGFHMIMKGGFSGGTAKGTLQILNDPQSGGACTGVTASWRAHNDNDDD